MPESLRTKHLQNLRTPAFRREARAAGRKLTGGPNACAATASQYYIALGILAHAELNTQGLVNALQRTGKFQRVELAALQPGDLIVTIDDPKDADQWPEHVWHFYGGLFSNQTAQPGFGWAVNNYADKPYPRNIAAGPKTRAWYGLRLVA